jgi:hypothetical protein
MHLSQLNIGRTLGAMDSPVMAEFRASLDPINALAEGTPGFVWRLQPETGNATDIVFSEDPLELVNLSVWESVAARPGYALWWIPEGHIPSVGEAKARLAHYREHGATPYAYWFSQVFPAAE